ncbi:MAG: ATP-binding protein [Balneola sp.]
MIQNIKITVQNYKCFGSEGGGFENILPLNVIIGKNNSGKSSLIDLIRFLTHDKEFKLISNSGTAKVIIEEPLTEEIISRGFSERTSQGGIPAQNHFIYGKKYIGSRWSYEVNQNQDKLFLNVDKDFVSHAKRLFVESLNQNPLPFNNKVFCHIAAERDIKVEPSRSEFNLEPDGVGATSSIQTIINLVTLESKIVEIDLLDALNSILNPDIYFKRILTQQINNSNWEIFFEDKTDRRIALSKMGSGIKTILLVLLNLLVRPKIEKNNPSKYIFAFEELENNLHPSLQRRLYKFIKDYTIKHDCHFFITTHSNVTIDALGADDNAQIIHVSNDSNTATTKTVQSFQDHKEILNDLEVKASDLLQTNGIIWVEGPSDRVYINSWLKLINENLIEGLHYSIMFYGGRLLSNLSFENEWFNEEFIPLLKINTNAFVVIDKDRKKMNQKVSETKQRIEKEIGENNCWITKGREIENYLTSDTIRNWLKEKGLNNKFEQTQFDKLEDLIRPITPKIKYNLKKVIYSREISKYFTVDSFNRLDLKEKILTLEQNIRTWNSL